MKTSTIAWIWIITSVIVAAAITMLSSTTSWRTFLIILGIVLVVTFMLRHFSPIKPNPQFVVFGIMTDIGIVLIAICQYTGLTPPPSVALPIVLAWLALSALIGMLWPFSRHHNKLIKKLHSIHPQHPRNQP